ncbi:molybdenum cofactor guanylyltransferase MobA [Amaricoccus sp.]|uniref:molybdenum cofactor guanylyltransferase MobA n=1 Tax=Amaricoccus sp. TaxID=1872485 RepID=UPI001B4B9969|nr:molybdenum cofactor guanylyltransferase MobA [Amaricoccus sp.]MBP7242224.1 molybdenum cofactor guanylyltransferase MobA [Amaricoccus sp.]
MTCNPASPPSETIAGVILAGGLSRRMGGGDKALLPLGGRPVLAHVIARFAPQVGPLALNANGDPGRFAGFGLPVAADGFQGFAGPLAGVLAAMHWAAGQGAGLVATVAADTPFLPRDLVGRLAAGIGGAPVAVAVAEDGAHPTCALWRVARRGDLAAALVAGTRRVTEWAAREGAAPVAFPDEAAFFNVNVPADLAEAEARLAQG